MTRRHADLLDDYAGLVGDLYCSHACGVCEPACPYRVPIQGKLLVAHTRLTMP